LETLWQDVRFGLKTLLRNPATTAVALLTLALGIGANSAIFSVVNGVLLRPLAFTEPDRLVMLWEANPGLGLPRFGVAPPNFEDWRRQAQSFTAMAALAENRFNLTGGERPEAIQGARVSAGFFRLLGVDPIRGRGFNADEDRAGGRPVVVISYGFWQRRFGGDANVLGQTLRLDGRPYTIVGVAPRGFDFYRKQELWVPLALRYDPRERGSHYLAALGRLKPGVSQERAATEMKALAGRLAQQFPDTNRGWTVDVVSLAASVVEDVRPRLLLLTWAVAFVLLIACANVANILLARLASREREIAVRAALGAGRGRLVRQMLTENVLLFLAGGALGLLVGFWSTRALLAFNPDAIPRAGEVGLDLRVILFTLGLALATGLLFGLVPALGGTGERLYDALREGGRAMAGGRHGRLMRSLLVLAEVAVALLLLAGAVLLIRSFNRLQAVDPGFRPAGVLTADLVLPAAKYQAAPRRAAFYRRLLEQLRAVPTVESTALIFPLPLAPRGILLTFTVEGRPVARPSEAPNSSIWAISTDYFRTMGVRLLSGRPFNSADDLRSLRVAIVNKTLADRLWPGESPLGRRITFDPPNDAEVHWITIVGVAGDVHHRGLNQDSGNEIYVPLEQQVSDEAYVLLRGRPLEAGPRGRERDPRTLVLPLRDAVAALDPDLPVDPVRPMMDVVDEALAQSRFQAVLLGLFAGLALALAAIGVYGVVSYTVAQRTHEIGIRMALGAQRAEVLRLVVRQGMKLVLAGVAVGLGLAVALSRYLADRAAAYLYGVSATDPVTLVVVPLLLLAVALVANFLPARRATRVDPLVALREE